jgi:DNA-binding PadR family transcriptional regulator
VGALVRGFDSIMTNEHYELLRMISEADESFNRINFSGNEDEVEAFRAKHGAIYQTLLNKKYVYGMISTFSELTLTEKGKEVLDEYEKTIESEHREGKKRLVDSKYNNKMLWFTLIGIFVGIIGIIIALLSYIHHD